MVKKIIVDGAKLSIEEKARLKGNPFDVPFEVLRRVVKSDKGNECNGCGKANMVQAEGRAAFSLNTVARVRGNCDSFENLEVYCRRCNPEND
jgi:hypothetical protein